jgi:hypothetical protein
MSAGPSSWRGGIIAAGHGVRLRQAGWAGSKAMAVVGGRALVDHALDRFHAAGIARVSVLVNAESPDARERLRVTPTDFRRAMERRSFGEMWVELESRSPRLVRQLVTGGLLRRELRRMRRLVEFARKADLARRAQAAWLAAERRQRRAARVA